jgi:hypothetical protein
MPEPFSGEAGQRQQAQCEEKVPMHTILRNMFLVVILVPRLASIIRRLTGYSVPFTMARRTRPRASTAADLRRAPETLVYLLKVCMRWTNGLDATKPNEKTKEPTPISICVRCSAYPRGA